MNKQQWTKICKEIVEDNFNDVSDNTNETILTESENTMDNDGNMFEVTVENNDFVEESIQAGTNIETNCINLDINNINFGLDYEVVLMEVSVGSAIKSKQIIPTLFEDTTDDGSDAYQKLIIGDIISGLN